MRVIEVCRPPLSSPGEERAKTGYVQLLESHHGFLFPSRGVRPRNNDGQSQALHDTNINRSSSVLRPLSFGFGLS